MSRMKSSSIKTILWLLLAFLAMLAHAWIVADAFNYMNGRDFFTFWLGGRMILDGQDPTVTTEWFNAVAHYTQEGLGYVKTPIYAYFNYPFYVAVLFIPLALLPYQVAAVLWLLLSQLMVAFTTWVVMGTWQTARKKSFIFPIVAALFVFRPLMVTLWSAQLGVLLLFLSALAAHLWRKQRWFWSGVALAFLLVKPTIGLPIIGITGLWLLRERRWHALAGGMTGGIGLLLLGMVVKPNWLPVFLGMGKHMIDVTFGYNPTLWGLGGALCQHTAPCQVWVGWALCIAAALAGIFSVYQKHLPLTPVQVIAFAIPPAVLITPYLWAYDQVILILPVLVCLGLLIERRVRYLIAATFFLLLDLIALLFVYIAAQSETDIISVGLPLLIWGLLLVFKLWERHHVQLRQPAA